VLARLARVFLAVSLLAAWQSALQHPIEHVDELGELVHRHGGHSDEGAEPLCDLLAALTACAAQSAVLLAPVPSEYDALAFPFRAPRAADAPPFLAQGPPARA
jgi:hypothetical protein